MRAKDTKTARNPIIEKIPVNVLVWASAIAGTKRMNNSLPRIITPSEAAKNPKTISAGLRSTLKKVKDTFKHEVLAWTHLTEEELLAELTAEDR